MSKAKKQSAVELGPDSDPKVLYTNYTKECVKVGIEPYGPLKDTLLNEENPNQGKQIIVVLPRIKGVDALGSGGCRALVNAMIAKDSSSVPFTATKELRICSSSLGDAGAQHISKLLMATSTKRPVDPKDPTSTQPEWKLEYIELMDNDIGAEGANALGRSLCVGMNRTLATLILDFNKVGSEGVHKLCKGLSSNSTLKKLSLKHCCIDKHGGKPIGEMLGFKKTALVSLDLTCNQIGCVGLTDICTAGLDENSSLKTLRIADNLIGQTDDDARALETLAEVLSKHPSLIGVDLNYNRIGNRGGEILVPAIRDNKQLTEFILDPSGMEEDLFKQLYRATSTAKKKKGKKGKGKKKK